MVNFQDQSFMKMRGSWEAGVSPYPSDRADLRLPEQARNWNQLLNNCFFDEYDYTAAIFLYKFEKSWWVNGTVPHL